MQGVATLVYRPRFGVHQRAISIEGALFEEKGDVAGGVQEVLICSLFLAGG